MTLAPHSDIATGRERLAGDELLAFMQGNASMSKTEMCISCGYLTVSGKPAFTDWFEAILEARGVPMNPTDAMQCADWYDSLTEQDQALYDTIEDFCPEFTKLDAQECQEFMDKLSDLGITTATQFEDAYYYQTDSWNAEAEFAQYIAEEVECLAFMNDANPGSWLVIDWQASWDTALRYDFNTIEFDGETYFFNNHF